MFFRGRSKYDWRKIFTDFGGRMASLSRYEEVNRTFLKTILEVSGAEGGTLLLPEDEGKSFGMKEHLGPRPLVFSVPSNHPLILWLFRDGRPLGRRQAAEDPKLIEVRLPSLNFFSEWNAEIAFPLVVEKKFLGVLNLGSKPASYDHDDLELLSALIGMGSVFIENSQLYERLLKQNLKLSELARLKTQFVSNVTHELRTPLHGILGMTDLLLDDPDQVLSEDYRRYLRMMKGSGDALLDLVDHILDLTKYQSGNITLQVKKLDLKKVIERAAAELQEQFHERKCQFRLEWPDATPGVYGDEVEVGHLVRDLLGNAVKFTERGSVAVSPKKCGEMLQVCIRDSGIGIDEKDQETIFEDFRQADGAATRSFGGSGLGLALAKKIVELHGGRIWVESKKGLGSFFYFTLPLKPSQIQISLKQDS